MNAIDLFCFMILISCGILGIRRGFLHSSTTMLGWALSGFFLVKRYPGLEAQLRFLEFSPEITSWIASALCAIVVLWFSYFLSGWIRDFAHAFGFLEADKVLGGLGGVTLGWISFVFMISLLNEFTELEESSVWKTSRAVKFMDQWENLHEPEMIRSIRGKMIKKSNDFKKGEQISKKNILELEKHFSQKSSSLESSSKDQSSESGEGPDREQEPAPMPPRKKFSKKPK